MTGIRRVLILSGLTLAVIVGSGIPASATFSESVALPTTTVTTVTVAPPTAVSWAGTWCQRSYDPLTYTHSLTLHAKLAWAPSGTRGASAYDIAAQLPGYGTISVGRVAGTATTASYVVHRGATQIPVGQFSVAATVSTVTSYNWFSAPSTPSAFSC